MNQEDSLSILDISSNCFTHENDVQFFNVPESYSEIHNSFYQERQNNEDINNLFYDSNIHYPIKKDNALLIPDDEPFPIILSKKQNKHTRVSF